MNRSFTLMIIGLAGLLASCGSSVVSSSQPGTNDTYTMVLTPDQFTLNAGDWSSVTATVDLSYENGTPHAVSPQPAIKFFSSDSRVTISPGGEVCAGQWDSEYLVCRVTSTLPSGYVTITAYDATHSVSETTRLSIHPRAVSITLDANDTADNGLYAWGSRKCVSQAQNNPVKTNQEQYTEVRYTATPVFASGSPTTDSGTPSTVYSNDYTWVVADSTIASVSTYGFVSARNPGVTSVYAKLNGTLSQPMTFVSCPPQSIVLASSQYINGTPTGPYSAADLDGISKGTQMYMTATMLDVNNQYLVTSPLSYITSNTLTGSFSTVLPLTSELTANTSGAFSVMASCEPSTCNAAVADFILPGQTTPTTGKSIGFGYPIYSNVIGVNVAGTTGSSVLVTGTQYANPTVSNGTTLTPHELLVYDSESLALTHTIVLANTPNSLVVSPDGTTAYVGSDDGLEGLVVVNLSTFTPTLQTYPISGGINTDVISGKVLGVSPNNRYVVVSDGTIVYLIDTTGTKVATRYYISGIDAVTFAADSSNFWIGGTSGVYVYQSDTFVKTTSNNGLPVKALAWTPDGQSYFASGDQLANYSTCDDQYQTTPNFTNPLSLSGGTTGPINLATTVINGISRVTGLAGTQWLDYSETSTAQVVGSKTSALATGLASGGSGNVCTSTVTVTATSSTPVASTLQCSPSQVSFSPTLAREFVTGVNSACTTPESAIHFYDLNTQTESTIATAESVVPLSGGVLNDGRKLYFGSFNSTANTAALHSLNLATSTSTTADDTSVSVELIPSFVAVVPK